MAESKEGFREAMARLGAAVNVITTDGPAGRHAMTASAVCSVTDDPPILLLCVNRSNDSRNVIAANGVLCVNTLTHKQQSLSPIFAGLSDIDSQDLRFNAGHWQTLATDAPVLREAAASFDCRVSRRVEVNTHSVFFCEVKASSLGA